MRKAVIGLLTMLVLELAAPSAGLAQDAAVERVKEMLRRTQEALRQAQAQNAELTKAKSDAEKRAADTAADATKQVESVKKSSQKGLNTKLQAAEGAQTALKEEITAANAELAAMTDKQRATAQLLANREGELAQTKQLLEQSRVANISCEDKNGKLYTYGAEMLKKYRDKGVFSALAQKDPVLGFKEVKIENVVQEYKFKMDAEKIKPAAQ